MDAESLIAAIALGGKSNGGGGGGVSSDYNDLTNKPRIGGNMLQGNKSASDLGLVSSDAMQDYYTKTETDAALDGKADSADIPAKTSDLTNDSGFVADADYVHTDNNYTNAEKTKLAGLSNYDDTAVRALINDKADASDLDGYVEKETGKALSSNDYTDAEKTKLAGLSNYDDTAVRALIDGKADSSDLNGYVEKETGKGLSSNDYTSAEKTKLAGLSNYDDTDLSDAVQANTDAISTLNGTGAGSVTKTVTDEIAKVVAGAPEDFDTLKEISDWIADHPDDASSLNAQITENKENIEALQDTVGDSTDGLVKDVADLKSGKADSSALAAVATSGAYSDLTGTPTIPAAYDDTALSGRVTAIEGKIPTGASASNQLATASDIPDISALESSVSDIEADANALEAKVDNNFLFLPSPGGGINYYKITIERSTGVHFTTYLCDGYVTFNGNIYNLTRGNSDYGSIAFAISDEVVYVRYSAHRGIRLMFGEKVISAEKLASEPSVTWKNVKDGNDALTTSDLTSTVTSGSSAPITSGGVYSAIAPSNETQIVDNIIYYERSGNVVTVTFNGFEIASLAENVGYSGLTFPTCAGAHGTYFSLTDYTTKANVMLRIQGNTLRGGAGGVTNVRVWGTVTYITSD